MTDLMELLGRQIEPNETPLTEGFCLGDMLKMGMSEGQARGQIKRWIREGIIEPSPERIERKNIHGMMSRVLAYRVVEQKTPS